MTLDDEVKEKSAHDEVLMEKNGMRRSDWRHAYAFKQCGGRIAKLYGF